MRTNQKTEYTLLHIEDSLDIQELVRHILRSRPSIKVLNALTVEEGVNSARDNLPNLILMDINLPDGTGLDALEKIQACQETASIPVVALSSMVTQLQIKEGLKKGFKYYITKPIDVPEMLETIDRILTIKS